LGEAVPAFGCLADSLRKIQTSHNRSVSTRLLCGSDRNHGG
jgi:hypothetical protein